ncbi:MAG: hypothetical protein J2P37_33455 [Ktedonobacteraceae bacterium]|nr:hypothetical protein [Ktedonobacteraceae bacterium]MBO0792251.1 hypothetical protein [Ktedonobacteraceae bacterium]
MSTNPYQTNPYQGGSSDQSDQYGGYSGTPSTGSQQSQDYQYGQQSAPDSSYQYGQYSPPTGATGQQQQQQQQQQQYSYQPPRSAQDRQEPGAITKSSRQGALISYLLGPFSGLVYFFILGRKDRFVRFAAAQSTVFFGPVIAVYIVLKIISVIPVLGFLLGGVIGFVTGILSIVAGLAWVFLMFMSYRGVKIRLPYFSDYADRMIDRFSK